MINELKRHLRRNPRGSNLVEFALVLFILVLLLIAVVDIGRAFHTYITITNASREGARYASRTPHTATTGDHIRDAVVQEALNGGIDLSDASIATISIDPENYTARAKGDPIIVAVEYQLETFIGGLVGLENVDMRSETEMILFGEYEPEE